ncbi:MAG: lipoyl synthase [Elusimicrobiales bacterium]|jgi:lipoic acid synthetase|nr:lipoyl synthase [Elusimicrobiales bacterium]
MGSYPDWIVAEVRKNKSGLRGAPARDTAGDLAGARLHTVCDEALCPNKGKCFAEGEATFLILGDICTRACSFCAVSKKKPLPPDPGEPARVGELSRRWGLKYVVFTSPTRDDLPDGGASHFAATLAALKRSAPGVKTEPLIPDFGGDGAALRTVLDAGPDVLGHNLETVPSLYAVRKGADYRRSLKLLGDAKKYRPASLVKTGFMLGLGETDAETEAALKDAVSAGCDLVTLGQYLAPSKGHFEVKRYYTPKEFEAWQRRAVELGFRAALAGPLVRSSYRAGRLYSQALAK